MVPEDAKTGTRDLLNHRVGELNLGLLGAHRMWHKVLSSTGTFVSTSLITTQMSLLMLPVQVSKPSKSPCSVPAKATTSPLVETHL